MPCRLGYANLAASKPRGINRSQTPSTSKVCFLEKILIKNKKIEENVFMSTLSVHPVYQGFHYRISNDENKEVGHLAGTSHDIVQLDKDCSFTDTMIDAMQKSNTFYLEFNPSEVENIQTVRSIDFKVFNFAIAAKKTVKGLESAEKRGSEMHEEAYKELSSEELLKLQGQFQALFVTKMVKPYILQVAYKHGDKQLAKLLALTDTSFDLKVLFWNRNPQMAEKIHASLQNGEQPFVAIGSGHLWGKKNNGEEGVVNLLRKKGWKIERIGKPIPQDLLNECIYNYLESCNTMIHPQLAVDEISRVVKESKK